MLGGVKEVQNQQGEWKADAGQFPNPGRSISQENHSRRQRHALLERQVSQLLAKLLAVVGGGNIAGAAGCAFGPLFGCRLRGRERGHFGGNRAKGLSFCRRAFWSGVWFFGRGLREHHPHFDLASFGLAILPFAFASQRFLPPHRHASAIGLRVEDRPFGQRGRGRLALIPPLKIRPRFLDQSLNASPANLHPAILAQALGGVLKRLQGAGPAHQARQTRGATLHQTQRLIQGHPTFWLVVAAVVIAPQLQGAKEAVHRVGPPGMTSLARLPHVSGHLHGRIVEQLLQAAAAIFVQGVPEFFLQAPHHRPRARQG